jgi:hypothetical protein
MNGTSDRTHEIEDLCDSWLATAMPSEGGGLTIGVATEQFRLRNNGIQFHELRYSELRAACLGLTKVLLHPGLNTVVDLDHKLFWSWCGELFAGSKSSYFGDDEREIKELFGLACRASLAGVYRPDKRGWEEQRDRTAAMEPNARELMHRGHTVLVYLALPLLEAMLKKACHAYVRYDGSVGAQFSVPRGKDRHQYDVGGRISSVRDLLWLLHEEVADLDLVDALDSQRSQIARLEPEKDPFDVLFRWRNSSLHGETSLPTIGGTVFNTAILVALDAVATDYESLRDRVVDQVRWEAQTVQLSASGYRSPWSYYPPYW